MPELAEGATIAGRYRLLRRLGLGGMGEVWLAMMEGAGTFRRKVVLKLVAPDRRGDERLESMLADEARVLGLLHHPGIVTALDFAEDPHLGPLLVLDYVDGPSLRSALKLAKRRQLGLPHELAAFIGAEVARALDFAHRAADVDGTALHLVHRDVSPDNVLLSSDGAVLLADFGVARATVNSEVTFPGAAPKGKRGYMAPEQAAGRPVGPQADVYSLGRVMAESIDGDPPEALKAVLDKATAAEPADRYASAAALAAALVAACPPPSEATLAVAAWLRQAAPEALQARDTSPGITPVSKPTPHRSGRTAPEQPPEPPMFSSVTRRKWPAPRFVLTALFFAALLGAPLALWLRFADSGKQNQAKAKPPVGELRVVSAPTGAEIYVDGTLRGYAPLLVKLPPGRHQLRVGAPRLERWRAAEIVIEANKSVSREIDLTE
jgi:serine/threonine protein kinase